MILRRAIKDTLSGQIAAFFVLVAGAGISLMYLYIKESPKVAVEEIPYVAGAILGAIGSIPLLFLWNLACAPYRIERDSHDATRRNVIKLENELGKDVVPTCIRNIITEKQCDVFISAHEHLQVHFSHKLQRPPDIITESMSIVGSRAFANSKTMSGVSLSVPQGIRATHDIAKTFADFPVIFDARTGDQISECARRLGFVDDVDKSDKFIVEALRDPDKGYAFLKKNLI